MTYRKMHLLKGLMIFIPLTVAVGHIGPITTAVGQRLPSHSPEGGAMLLFPVLVTLLALALSYVFVETLFRVLRELQAEALARGQDLLTLNAVLQERERLSRELHDGAAQLVAHLLLHLDIVRELVEADRRLEAAAEPARLHGMADDISADIGESISGLRADVMDGGLVRALQDYVDQFEERHQISVSLRTDQAFARL